MALEPGEVAQVDVRINEALEPVFSKINRVANTTERILALAEAQATTEAARTEREPNVVTKDYLNARLAAVEARIDGVEGHVESLPTTGKIWAAVGVAVAAASGLVAAIVVIIQAAQ